MFQVKWASQINVHVHWLNYLNGRNLLRLSLQEYIANSNNLILSNTSLDIELETECRVNHNNTTPVIEWKRFSSWRKLAHHFAWIKLLVRRRKFKESVPSVLYSDLLNDSAKVIILLIQSEAFSMEIKQFVTILHYQIIVNFSN